MRRHKALQAKPNPGHYALTELAKKVPDFITLTQNVDGRFYSHLLNSTRQVTSVILPGSPFLFLNT
jgi:NAD-dependent SIR2 family protein deacetylase